jgi:hypothetical protein
MNPGRLIPSNFATMCAPIRHELRRWLIVLALILLPSARTAFGQAAAAAVKTNPPPAWVEPIAPEEEAPRQPGDGNSGEAFALIESQINAATAESYLHVVREVTSSAGVENAANLQFDWDPSYQELTLHQIIIHREGEKMDRLASARFKVIQKETDLDRLVYNGTLSAVLFLEDVRVGDRIEYAFSVRGQNPSLNGRYSDSYALGASVPIGRRRVRLLWPENRTLNYRLQGGAPAPSIQARNGVREYVWDLRHLPAIALEDQTPSWLLPYPWIQLTEFKNWSDVAAWAASLYVTANLDAPEWTGELADLKRAGDGPEKTIQAAVDFVQRDVRYLGIEFGPNSYHPTDPVTVLQRRFGDCKDKAFLLCTLLNALGYDATPVLIGTGFRQTLPDLLPMPSDFDHAIVRVVGLGTTNWIDPTRSTQRGPISQRYLPDYAYGLLVRPGETGLTPIPGARGGVPEIRTIEVFRVNGQKAPADLSVMDVYTGYDAEWMRAILNSVGSDRMAKSYLNDYAQRYPGVSTSRPLDIEDSHDSDTLTIRRSYSISNFWVLSTKQDRYFCQFYPSAIQSWITKPTTAVRSMPLEVSFPRRRVVETRIELPRQFDLKDSDSTISGPASELRIRHRYANQTMTIDYDYQALTNFIPVSRMTAHLSALDRMENVLTYTLQWQNLALINNTSQFNWPIFFVATIYAVLFTVGASLLCRYQYRPSTMPSVPPLLPGHRLNGLGGWLILVGLRLILVPIQLGALFFRELGPYSAWRWHNLTDAAGMSYHPAWGPLLTFELLGRISTLILSLIAVVLFFQKRRIFPFWFIALLLSDALFVAGYAIGVQFLKSVMPGLTAKLPFMVMAAGLSCSIWIPYALISRRVKATFVR